MARQDPLALLERSIAALDEIADPIVRAQAATAYLEALGEANEEVRELRREAVLELNEAGYGYSKIADMLGITKARAQQLVNGWRSPKRPGVIEVQTRIAVGELRAAGEAEEAIARALIPGIRDHKGGSKLSASQIAHILDMPYRLVKPIVASVDAARRAA